jgi:hypothetical protein
MDKLILLIKEIGDAYQRKKCHCTIIDLKKVYARVWSKGLLFKMLKIGITWHIYKWIEDFICNRTIQTTYTGSSI